ncbi:GDSL esterase/lipase At5g03810 [Cryptomeria japonica]|uniref:GDSL esterase/lipase At5g03810 n=1 Tax=Cryptomeria japonica TaxID=3369 RepID=UPI0027DA6CFC|nr:GDSL esterase/lipase At5g03810 [Cryptomeria japonica]
MGKPIGVRPLGPRPMLRPLCMIAVCLAMVVCSVHGQLVPALYIFGDSTVDVGNNNYLYTLVKSDFPPYGRDFDTHVPTGRFCDGRLATDYVSETLGFTSFPPAYLSPQASGKNIITGVNFASGASGIYDETAKLYNAISLTQQLQYFHQYQSKLTSLVGQQNASSTVSQALYILSSGASDFVQNYYISPILLKTFTVPQYIDTLILPMVSRFVQTLYKFGGRRIGITSLPPMGCLPAAITLFGHGSNDCVTRLNQDALLYNRKLNSTVKGLAAKLPGLKIAVFDIYTALLDIVKHPSDNGFAETRRACCGTGIIETSILCNEKSFGTCSNASSYVFWDSFHPSQAANEVLSSSLVLQGISLIF